MNPLVIRAILLTLSMLFANTMIIIMFITHKQTCTKLTCIYLHIKDKSCVQPVTDICEYFKFILCVHSMGVRGCLWLYFVATLRRYKLVAKCVCVLLFYVHDAIAK